MSNVIDIRSRMAGEAFCFHCKHEWIATAPTGATQLECPKCGSLKGIFKFPACVEEGQLIRQCKCGNDLFYLTPEGHLCPNCGIYQTY